MLILSPDGRGFAFDPLLLLLLALLIEPWVGWAADLLFTVPHPVRIIGRVIGVLDRKLNRSERSEADRVGRGVLVVVAVCGLSAAVGGVVTWLNKGTPFGWVVELVLTISLLAQRSLYDHVRAVAAALKAGSLKASRAAVSHIVGRDVDKLDAHGVARAAIESCAENFSDAVVAPTFWYALLGFPGLLVYKAVNTMDSMIGYRSPRYRAFGRAAARLDDALNLIPARLAGLFLATAAAVVPTADPRAALAVMIRDAGKHRSPNAGWPEGAMAGALGLALAGPRRYSGAAVVDDPWIGNGRTGATKRDIDRALAVFAIGCFVNGLAVAAVWLLRRALV